MSKRDYYLCDCCNEKCFYDADIPRLLRRWAAKADDDGDSLTDALVFIDTLIDPVEAN